MSALQQIFKRYRDKQATADEQQLIDGWYAFYEGEADPELSVADATRIEQSIWSKIGAAAVDRADLPAMPGAPIGNTGGKAPVRRLWPYAAAAAIVVLITSVAFWVMVHSSKKEVSAASMVVANDAMKTFFLPDSTQVVLNRSSSLQWNEQYNATDRRVVLKGEGYFKVHKDRQRPFIVETNGVLTQALGTAFNIEAYQQESEIRVALLEGSVEVKSAAATFAPAILKPGELLRFRYDIKAAQVQTMTAGNAIAWTSGGMSFHAIPLTEALDRLATRYQVTIQYDRKQLQSKTVSGSFQALPLQQLLPHILFTHNLRYTRKDNLIRVY